MSGPGVAYYRLSLADTAARHMVLRGLRDASNISVDELKVFSSGQPADYRDSLRYSAPDRGKVADWLWSAMMIPVISTRLADRLQGFASASIQLVPVQLPQKGLSMLIVNILAVPDCIDESRSQVQRSNPTGAFARAGLKYDSVNILVLDPKRTEGHHILRPMHWRQAVCVSEECREVLERFDTHSIVYCPVT